MKTAINEKSLEWARTHLIRFGDNDFFPAAFEFGVLASKWNEIKPQLLAINLATHEPRPPLVRFAPRRDGAFRILHRLDPIDSLIYTALVYEILQTPETAGSEAIEARSLHIEPTPDGSFLHATRNSWQNYIDRISRLSQEFRGPQNTGGYVLMTDIQDFFGHIQPRRLIRFLAESRPARPDRIQMLGKFLGALCTGAGRGLPAGPSASTVLAETLLTAIDRKLLDSGNAFARWGDDFRIFFRTRADAETAMEELSTYLNDVHEMALSPHKTRLVSIEEFESHHFRRLPDESRDAGEAEIRLNRFAGQSAQPLLYAWMVEPASEAQSLTIYSQMRQQPDFHEASETYLAHFKRAITASPPDLVAARRILRKAAMFRMPALLPSLLAHFDKTGPVIREAAAYLNAVLDSENVRTYGAQLRNAWEKKVHVSTYISEWMSHLFTNPCFNEIGLPANYNDIPDVRSKALIALRKGDEDWVKRNISHLDAMDFWDKRAVIYAGALLTDTDRKAAVKSVKRGIMERIVARWLEVAPAGAKRASAAFESDGARQGKDWAAGTGSSGGYGVRGPDNYPSYGDKVAGSRLGSSGNFEVRGPDNYPSYGDKVAGSRSEPARGIEVRGPDNYPSYGDKVAGSRLGSSGNFEVRGPDNYPSYGDKVAGSRSEPIGSARATSWEDRDSNQEETEGTGSSGGYGLDDPQYGNLDTKE
jgi:hypothetical protein